MKVTEYGKSNLTDLSRFFSCWFFNLGLLKLKIEVRQDTPKALDCKPLVNTYYHIGQEMELKYFLSAH